jgi:hypothetical protein
VSDEHVEVDWNTAPPEVRAWYIQQIQAARAARAAEEAAANPPRNDTYKSGPATWDLTPDADGRKTTPDVLDPRYYSRVLDRVRSSRR